jgi:hypothetical protein
MTKKVYAAHCVCGAIIEGTILTGGAAVVSKSGKSKHVGPPPADCPYCGKPLPTRSLQSNRIRTTAGRS